MSGATPLAMPIKPLLCRVIRAPKTTSCKAIPITDRRDVAQADFILARLIGLLDGRTITVSRAPVTVRRKFEGGGACVWERFRTIKPIWELISVCGKGRRAP